MLVCIVLILVFGFSLVVLVGCVGKQEVVVCWQGEVVLVIVQVVQFMQWNDILQVLGMVKVCELISVIVKVSEIVEKVYFESGQYIVVGVLIVMLCGQVQEVVLVQVQVIFYEVDQLYKCQCELVVQWLVFSVMLDMQKLICDVVEVCVMQMQVDIGD